MSTKDHFFNFLVAISVISCTAAHPVNTPVVEIKTETARPAKSDSLLATLMQQQPDNFKDILQNSEALRVQIIYTQINRSSDNKPIFKNYYYGVDPSLYFYPASTVKLPVAVLALQKLNELRIPGLDKASTMITDAGYDGQTEVYNDPESVDGRPTIGGYIKKILLVSDNDAYNRLYEFLGQAYINQTLHHMGWEGVQIIHRLNVALSEEQNRHTNPVTFFSAAGNLLYKKPLERSNLIYHQKNIHLGNGYMSGDSLIEKPFDFSKKNRLLLPDLHGMLQSILFPEAVSKKQQFNISEEDRLYLKKYMSMKPSESAYPSYDSTYGDAYVKFLMYGGEGKIAEPGIRIFNKPGDAYGFLTDAAYIVDFDKGIEFMLSATIFCNSDGIFNDDTYDYEKIGFPFLKNLGRLIYDYEKNRVKKHPPNLSAFKINYAAPN